MLLQFHDFCLSFFVSQIIGYYHKLNIVNLCPISLQIRFFREKSIHLSILIVQISEYGLKKLLYLTAGERDNRLVSKAVLFHY